ncbi:MAG: hypothetical protein GX605_07970 [Chloroflexi bacterium]|nr:hypothetical protein [Chloroflexota bacterium]
MQKVDLKKELKHLYSPSAHEVNVVQVPTMNALMVDGEGDPNSSVPFGQATEALMGMSYTLKFMSKQQEERDYTVLPLEGLWWADDMAVFRWGSKADWRWTLLVLQPDWITPAMFDQARQELSRKKKPPALPKLRFQPFEEGLAAQILHMGPYATEGPTIDRLHHFIQENGYQFRGAHHEIYLGDPRRTPPERLRTVLRQPIAQ